LDLLWNLGRIFDWVLGNGSGSFLINTSGCASNGVGDCISSMTSMELDQIEPLFLFSRFRLSVALRSVASVQRTAQPFFGSELYARTWKCNRSGGCGESNLH
jgi:hypothetical protein